MCMCYSADWLMVGIVLMERWAMHKIYNHENWIPTHKSLHDAANISLYTSSVVQTIL